MNLKRKNQYSTRTWLKGTVAVIFVSLWGCHGDFAEKQSESGIRDNVEQGQDGTGKKLTEVAGRATLQNDAEYVIRKLDIREQQFVGRYRTEIQCDGHFFPCETGKADFILNILPDGSVHRSVVRLGKVFAEKQRPGFPILNYQRDTWSINEDSKELVVHRKEGLNFYYRVLDSQTLQMNLNKSNHLDADNQKLYARGFPKLEQVYTLKRIPNS